MKALHLSNDPFTVETCGNLFVRKDTFVSHIGRLDNLQYVVYYESMKREVKTRPMYECRWDERLKTKTEESMRLVYTGLLGELEHLKIETR
jgi:hypothetical protein